MLLPERVDLFDYESNDIEQLTHTARTTAAQSGQEARPVVLETLNSNLAADDENLLSAMGRLINKFDRIRMQTGAHVLLIHHIGKDAAKGARGHTSLRGAVDCEIRFRKDRHSTASIAEVTKARNHREGDTFRFTLEMAETGGSNNLASCVVRHLEDDPAAPKGRSLTRFQQIGLQALENIAKSEGKPPPDSTDIPRHVSVVPRSRWRDVAFCAGITKGDTSDTRKKAYERIKKTSFNILI